MRRDARAGTGGTPSRWSVWAALLLIYVVWARRTLAIRVNVEKMPPMLSGGIRADATPTGVPADVEAR